MKFLIIGASGFIGSSTLEYLKSQGFEALGTQSSSKIPGLVEYDIQKHSIKKQVPAGFFKDKDVYCLICVAASKIDYCYQYKKESHAINVESTIKLIDELKSLGATPIFISSSTVFDGKTGYYNEKSKTNPICEYGRQKLEVEEYLLKKVPGSVIIRLDKVLGDLPYYNHLLAEMFRLIQAGKTVECFQGCILSPTYVKDVSKAVLLCSQKKLSGLFHISNSEFFTREELARQFGMALGFETKIISKPMEEFQLLDKRPMKSYFDGSKFVKATGMRFTSMHSVFDEFKKKMNLGPEEAKK